MSIVYFLILIGVLVFVHEFGHFIIARLFDVKVLRFSLGFGPKVVGFQRGETEYVICALPLGGYVQMLGSSMEDIESIEPEDRPRALMAKPIWQRSLVVLAGPVFNLILPVFIYFLVAMGQTTAPPSIIGEVFTDTPAAAAGLQPGDHIRAIDGEPVRYWHDVVSNVSSKYDQQLTIEFERDGKLHTVQTTPERKTATDTLGIDRRTYGLLGIHLGTYGTTLAIADRDGPAAAAGLQFFDRVVAIDGEAVDRFDEIEAAVRNSEGKPLEFVVLRRMPIDASFANLYAQDVATLTVTPELRDGTYTAGIEAAEMYLVRVEPDSPAARAGLQPGDKLVGLEGRPYNSWSLMLQSINNSINQQIVARDEAGQREEQPLEPSFELEYERAGSRHTTTFAPVVHSYLDETKQQRYRIELGWGHFRDVVYPDDIEFPFFARTLYAAGQGLSQTGDFIKMMVTGLVRMAQGRVSSESLGGPIMIGELAAQAGRAGWEPFLRMMALISINLAVLNLLPIPMLDGGHLVMFALEAIKRGPLSYRTRQIAAYIGFVLLIFVMIYAFKNDIERNWYRVVEYFDAG